jgi:hypothetical protein
MEAKWFFYKRKLAKPQSNTSHERNIPEERMELPSLHRENFEVL